MANNYIVKYLQVFLVVWSCLFSSIAEAYDADGNCVSKVVLDGALGLREHHYLVDTNNHTGYSQVVEEKDTSGNLLSHKYMSFWEGSLEYLSLLQELPWKHQLKLHFLF